MKTLFKLKLILLFAIACGKSNFNSLSYSANKESGLQQEEKKDDDIRRDPNDPVNTSNLPTEVLISGLPGGYSSATKLEGIASQVPFYTYVLVDHGTSTCPTEISKYPEMREISEKIQLDITDRENGSVLICAIGKNAKNEIQDVKTPTRVEWFKDTSSATVQLIGAPIGKNKQIDLDIKVVGSDVVSYKYAIVSGSTCEGASYSDKVAISKRITDSLTALPDGDITICALGIDSIDTQQQAPTLAHWRKDTKGPTLKLVGIPSNNSTVRNFSVNVTSVDSDFTEFEFKVTDSHADCKIDSGAIKFSKNKHIQRQQMPVGQKQICVRGYDDIGNVGEIVKAIWTRVGEACGAVAHNSYEYSPIRFKTASVPYGQNCSSIQGQDSRRCNDGTFAAWSKIYPHISCNPEPPANCPLINGTTILHGSYESKTGFSRSSVEHYQSCYSYHGTDRRLCNNGSFQGWSQNYPHASCYQLPAPPPTPTPKTPCRNLGGYSYKGKCYLKSSLGGTCSNVCQGGWTYAPSLSGLGTNGSACLQAFQALGQPVGGGPNNATGNLGCHIVNPTTTYVTGDNNNNIVGYQSGVTANKMARQNGTAPAVRLCECQ